MSLTFTTTELIQKSSSNLIKRPLNTKHPQNHLKRKTNEDILNHPLSIYRLLCNTSKRGWKQSRDRCR